MENVKVKEQLTSKELNKICRRFYWGYGSFPGYDALAGRQYMWGLTSLYEKYYDNERQCAEIRKHNEFYNTEGMFGGLINGIVTAMEEKKAIDNSIDDELIRSTKMSLMGPVAGIGDAMNPGLIVPLLLSIAIALSQGGSLVGVLFYAVTYNIISWIIFRILFFQGHKLGKDAVNVLVGEKANAIKDSFILLGTIVMGGIASSYINLSLQVTIPSGEDQILLQDLLDGIFPKLVPLVVVLLSWYFMSKKQVSTLRMIFTFFILAFVFALIGII